DGSTVLFGGLPNPYSVETSVFVPPTTGAVLGQQPGNFVLIPDPYVQQLAGALNATTVLEFVLEVKPRGMSVGGAHVTMATWTFPVYACKGCLVTPGTTDTTCPCLPGQEVSPTLCKPRMMQ